jgi:isocitrate dehydrogenase
MEAHVEVARRAHDRRRFLRQREVGLIADAGSVKIELTTTDGVKKVLKEKTAVKAGEVIDASVMSRKALRSFIEAQIADAKAQACCSRCT